mmetsp:Transcript_30052/g.75642  ORF Transcript_30052/g.75642 Transcript_30052/m.75642 type:complete len:249 (+) Transcript_30052:150-896(+)
MLNVEEVRNSCGAEMVKKAVQVFSSKLWKNKMDADKADTLLPPRIEQHKQRVAHRGAALATRILEREQTGDAVTSVLAEVATSTSTGQLCSYTVSVKRSTGHMTCTCREMEDTRLPCPHLAAVVANVPGWSLDELFFYPPEFRTATWKQTYAHLSVPRSMVDDSLADRLTDLKMPIPRVRPGRPKRKRQERLERREVRTRTVHCSRCGGANHNASSCPLPDPTHVRRGLSAAQLQLARQEIVDVIVID